MRVSSSYNIYIHTLTQYESMRKAPNGGGGKSKTKQGGLELDEK